LCTGETEREREREREREGETGGMDKERLREKGEFGRSSNPMIAP